MHMKKVCQYGFIHTQCRCPAKDKKVVTIQCDMPNAHAPEKPKPLKVDTPVFDVVESPNKPWVDIVDDFLAPDDLPTRLDTVLEHRLWWMKDSERSALLSDLMEQINNT